MKRISILAFVLVASLGIAFGNATQAHAAASNVVGTYSIADNGQGAWGGGALLDDGSVTGQVAFSAGNGQLIAKFVPTGWSFTDATDSAVQVCFNVVAIKGPVAQYLGTSFCGVLPVTGTPIKVIGADGSSTVMRVTINQ